MQIQLFFFFVYRRFVELFVLFADMAFNTSSCKVDGGSDRISVVVDKYRNLSDTAANEKYQLEPKAIIFSSLKSRQLWITWSNFD